MNAQLDTFIDAASKLAQGGPTLVLVFGLLVAIWGLKVIFEAYRETTQATIAAITAQTEAVQTMTRAIEENERTSIANRASIDGLKEILLSWLTEGRRGR